jgi:hypothetical protein
VLVAFSCKGRGICPSCGARRMCNEAAQLVDRDLPNVPIATSRQVSGSCSTSSFATFPLGAARRTPHRTAPFSGLPITTQSTPSRCLTTRTRSSPSSFASRRPCSCSGSMRGRRGRHAERRPPARSGARDDR